MLLLERTDVGTGKTSAFVPHQLPFSAVNVDLVNRKLKNGKTSFSSSTPEWVGVFLYMSS